MRRLLPDNVQSELAFPAGSNLRSGIRTIHLVREIIIVCSICAGFSPLRWLRYLAYAGVVTTGLFYFTVMVGYLVLCAPTNSHSELAFLTGFNSPKF